MIVYGAMRHGESAESPGRLRTLPAGVVTPNESIGGVAGMELVRVPAIISHKSDQSELLLRRRLA